MSAKRIKVEGSSSSSSSSNRRRNRIPIPSFASMSAAFDASAPRDRYDDDDNANDDGAPLKPSPVVLPLPNYYKFNQEDLIRIETALELYFHSQKPNNLISFDDFYALCSKVPLSSAGSCVVNDKVDKADGVDVDVDVDTTTTTTSTITKDQMDISDLSEAERHLFHLLRLTLPTLYRILHVENDDDDNDDDDDKKVSVNHSGVRSKGQQQRGESRRMYYVERIHFTGNRMSEFRRLVSQQQHQQQQDRQLPNRDCISSCLDILSAIRANRANRLEKNHKSSSSKSRAPSASLASALEVNTNSNSNRVILLQEPLLRPGMTLDERVRAREEVRLQREAAATSTNDQKAATNNDTYMDRAWLVRLADALWNYSSDLQRRQTRFQPLIKSKQQQTKMSSLSSSSSSSFYCTLTLQDAVSFLQRTLLAGGMTTQAHTGSGRGEKTSRRELVNAIVELQKLVPEWIQVTESSNSGDNKKGTASSLATSNNGNGNTNHHLSKNATVWIYHDHYKQARVTLTGKPSILEQTDQRIPARTSSSSSMMMVDNGSDEKSTDARLSIQNNNNKRPLEATSSPPTAEAISQLRTTVDSDDNKTLQHSKKPKYSEESNLMQDLDHQQQQPPPPPPPSSPVSSCGTSQLLPPLLQVLSSTTKAQNEGSPLSTSRMKKQSNILRINPNLILSDADHNGGEVIRLTTRESPRGLKILFDQINAGKRI